MKPDPEPRSVFVKDATIEDINRTHIGTIVSHLGMVFTERGADYLCGRMPVDERTKQPAGILHGGASVVLAESLGSVAAWLCLEEGWSSVGLDINANHIRPVTRGWVHGAARPAHVGRTTQVWNIDIVDDRGKLTCTSRITIAVVPMRR